MLDLEPVGAGAGGFTLDRDDHHVGGIALRRAAAGLVARRVERVPGAALKQAAAAAGAARAADSQARPAGARPRSVAERKAGARIGKWLLIPGRRGVKGVAPSALLAKGGPLDLGVLQVTNGTGGRDGITASEGVRAECGEAMRQETCRTT
jgi:hypothetical protein